MKEKKRPSVLIADDDAEICKLVQLAIQDVTAQIEKAYSGKETLELVETFKPDILILDINFPDLDGFSLCSWIRKQENIAQPIIIVLSARNSDKDKLFGYDIGADEFISKPFSSKFLKKRIEMLWAQKKNMPNTASEKKIMRYREIEIDKEQKRVYIEKKETYLTFMEWQILTILMKNPGTVFSRSDLLQLIKGEQYIIYNRTIDVHLFSLRKKLGSRKHYIKTKRNMGYYLEPEP